MGNFSGTVLTPYGRDLAAKGQTGVAINFSRVALGDGVWVPEDSPDTLLGLVSEKMSAPIQSMELVGDGTSRLRAFITNSGMTVGFYVREIGIFADDPDRGEILYAVAYAGDESDYLPAEGAVGVEEILDLITVVGNATAVTAEISEYLLIASKDDLDAQAAYIQQTISDIGLLAKEIDSQRFSRHQEATVTIYNRGIKSGCVVSKSGTATRNLNIANGVMFGHGNECGVPDLINTASVPSNNTGSSATCLVYLLVASGQVDLVCTALDGVAPIDSLVVAQLTVPAGSDDASDQYLASCTLTAIARQEPGWPTVQGSPAYKDITHARQMASTEYTLALDVVDFEGGERPELETPSVNRAVNACRIYLGGSADAVQVRQVAHLMSL